MSNKEKIGWCAGVILLVILYLLSSTDLIIKEKKKEIFRVSVIVDQVNVSGGCEFYHAVCRK